MIRGSVTPAGEAIISLYVRGPEQGREIQAVIDSGFTGFLTMPLDLIHGLGLAFSHHTQAALANGEVEFFSSYRAAVMWEQRLRPIIVMRSGGEILAGMMLLNGSRLTVDVIDGGEVRIEPLQHL